MIGVTVAQLYRLQHTEHPNSVFGYFVLSKPVASMFQCAALGTALLGAVRFFRQQSAMAIGRVHAGGWEVFTIGFFVFFVRHVPLRECPCLSADKSIAFAWDVCGARRR